MINVITSKSNGIKLVHLNARSLKNREHLAQIKELVNDENVDVLAISESRLKSSTTNAEVEILGYKIYRLDRKRKKGGGVCIYVRKEFKVTMLKNFSYISIYQLVKDPTRITPHSRSLLDVIMISCPLIWKDSGVVDMGISDHSMVFCILKLKTVKPHPTHIYARSLKHYDPNQFVMDLSRLPLI